jgi:hypothetical protein
MIFINMEVRFELISLFLFLMIISDKGQEEGGEVEGEGGMIEQVEISEQPEEVTAE